MQYAQLGKSDLNVSRICFGCWQLAPAFWGDVPLEPWEKALHSAIDLGVNFIDTANAYGDGYAEECLGNYFAKTGTRDKFVLATKFFWVIHDDGGRHVDTSYDSIIEECEKSLRRLQTDRIDLYQVHAFDPLTRPDRVAAALKLLQDQGKVRHFGVSNLNVEQMRMYAKHIEIASLQPPYSLLARDVEACELPYCLAENIGVIPYSSLFRGLLTGKYERDHKFTDSRKNIPLFNGNAFQRILDAMDELAPIAADLDLTVPQLAIRWNLTHPAVTAPIVGVKTPDHIEGIVAAADDVLPVELWHQVAETLQTAKKEALATTA